MFADASQPRFEGIMVSSSGKSVGDIMTCRAKEDEIVWNI